MSDEQILASGNRIYAPPLGVTPEAQPSRADLDRFAQAASAAGAEDVASAEQAIARLRAGGPVALRALLDELARWEGKDAARASRLKEAADKVARQRHAHASGLYWYTDLEEAKKAAQAGKKPILSLRLLGDLGEELSCANSRFFRVALYADPRVSAYLRSRYILHWSSERPAPRLVVDYGDGRKLVRTVTGNSIHYVLDAQGRPVDALPGLYGPWAFLRRLMGIESLAQGASGLDDATLSATLTAFHQAELSVEEQTWGQDLAMVGAEGEAVPAAAPASGPSPSAAEAAPVAYAKVLAEMPAVRALLPGDPRAKGKAEPPWEKLALLHRAEARLSVEGKALMRAKSPLDWSTDSKEPRPLSDEAFARLVDRFEQAMAEDTVRNEYIRRTTLHRWFVSEAKPSVSTLAALNRKVYSELFLTPASDPWLGLLQPGVFSAIDGDGVEVKR